MFILPRYFQYMPHGRSKSALRTFSDVLNIVSVYVLSKGLNMLEK